MNAEYDAVRKFHEVFQHPVSDVPCLLSKERVQTRSSWMEEELAEFKRASNIVDQADAIIDLLYFGLGTLVEMGIPPDELFSLVQEANMSKLWPDGKPHFREFDHKTIKPAGWQTPEPRMQAVINRMIDEYKNRLAVVNE